MFIAMTTVKLIEQPLNVLPLLISYGIVCLVSLRRIETYLSINEV